MGHPGPARPLPGLFAFCLCFDSLFEFINIQGRLTMKRLVLRYRPEFRSLVAYREKYGGRRLIYIVAWWGWSALGVCCEPKDQIGVLCVLHDFVSSPLT